MKNAAIIPLLFILWLFCFSMAACRGADGTTDPTPDSLDPDAIVQPDYENEEDPVKALIVYSFSSPTASHMVWVGEDHDTVSNKTLSELLDFPSWEKTLETDEGDPELITEIGECSLELHGNLMKVQHLEVDWPTKLDFDCQWYRIPDEANEKTHEWLKTVNLDRYAYVGGTKMFKFVDRESGIYRLKDNVPQKVLFHETNGQDEENYATSNEKKIHDLMESFAELRVMEKQENPEGKSLTITFLFEDSSNIQLRFVGQYMEYEGNFYSLYTKLGFFRYVDQIKEGK